MSFLCGVGCKRTVILEIRNGFLSTFHHYELERDAQLNRSILTYGFECITIPTTDSRIDLIVTTCSEILCHTDYESLSEIWSRVAQT